MICFAAHRTYDLRLDEFLQESYSNPKQHPVLEKTFTILRFEHFYSLGLSSFNIAFRANNPEDGWSQAYQVLKEAQATIRKRYHREGYNSSYWLFEEGKIYQKKLKSIGANTFDGAT